MKTLAAPAAGLTLLSVVLLASQGRSFAAEAEIQSYLVAVERICATGVTRKPPSVGIVLASQLLADTGRCAFRPADVSLRRHDVRGPCLTTAS